MTTMELRRAIALVAAYAAAAEAQRRRELKATARLAVVLGRIHAQRARDLLPLIEALGRVGAPQ